MKYNRETANCANYDLLKDNAKRMRKNSTEAEYNAWVLLRTSFPKVKFRRQHIIGDYIADFVCLKFNLVIEIDGGYHFTEEQKAEDERRVLFMNQNGFKVMRFTNEEVMFAPDKVIN